MKRGNEPFDVGVPTFLQIAPGLMLPLEAATRRLAILAMSGAGKSNTAVVLAEHFFHAHVPWVAIDPKGDWWGIRSSRDGKGPGLPIPIFGGQHGDLPLTPKSGAILATLIVDKRLTCVVDISEFTNRQEMWAFLIDFGDTLLHKNREALHLFLEEADEYLPQKTSEKGNLPKCLGVWQRVVKRGRFRGIGSTQITQRNAALNKDTLYQAELLIAMRCTGKEDRRAVAGWVEYAGASKEIVESLPTLADGEGWVSSPAWLRETKRVKFPRRSTFDSGATPVLSRGQERPPATLADVDLEALRTEMGAAIEKASEDDPKVLRQTIAALRDRLREADHTIDVARAQVRVERVPFVSEAVYKLAEALNNDLGAMVDPLERARMNVSRLFAELNEARARMESGPTFKGIPLFPQREDRDRPPAREYMKPPGTLDDRLFRPDGRLRPHVQKFVTALAQHPDGLTRQQLHLYAGLAPSGDTSTALAAMLEEEWIGHDHGRLRGYQASLARFGPFEPLPTGRALLHYYVSGNKLTTTEKRLLSAISFTPKSRAEIHEAAGLKPSGDTSSALAKFLRLGWVRVDNRRLALSAIFQD